MKKLLGIVVLGISFLLYFIWPTNNRMVDYCAYSKFGIQTEYDQNLDLHIILEAFGDLYVPSIIECAKELNKDPKLFKTIYLKETSYANLDRLLNFSKQ
tara:strand:+ start:281 stop:577 length:297 start_codon:yes stop_codon:yes gene_type:complete